MKEIAIIGPTASGKSALAVEVAKEVGAYILSLDSLSIYKEVDIVSAKPTLEEREGIRHFGIDEIRVDEYFSAGIFLDIYKRAKERCKEDDKHLIITGGTSFYLKALIEGLSPKPTLTPKISTRVTEITKNLSDAYKTIAQKDPDYASKISPNDSYRISKWYEIYLSTNEIATKFFKSSGKEPLIKNIDIFEIEVDREHLRDKIAKRTKQMIKNGLIEEIFELERKYTRAPSPMKAIGIKETLAYLDGRVSLSELEKLITIHTSQLAKRQQIFNRTQFKYIQRDVKESLKSKLKYIF